MMMIDLRSSNRVDPIVDRRRVDVPARTAVALARVVVVGVIAVGIGIVIVIGVVIDIIVSSSRRGGLCRVASFRRSALFRWRPIRSIGDGIPGWFSMISWSKLESRTVRVIHPIQEDQQEDQPTGWGGRLLGLSRTRCELRIAVIGDGGDTTSIPLCSGF